MLRLTVGEIYFSVCGPWNFHWAWGKKSRKKKKGEGKGIRKKGREKGIEKRE